MLSNVSISSLSPYYQTIIPSTTPSNCNCIVRLFSLCVMILNWRNETYIMRIKVYIQLSDVSGRRQGDVTRRRRRSVRTDGRTNATPLPLLLLLSHAIHIFSHNYHYYDGKEKTCNIKLENNICIVFCVKTIIVVN